MSALTELLIPPDSSIRMAMECIDRNARGIAIVAHEDRRLIATLTDGDIRRAILAGVDLSLPVSEVLHGRPAPFTAPIGTSDAQLLRLMTEHGLRHIPLLDESGRIAAVAQLSDLIKEYELPLTAVVMAGGLGMRLRPLTEDVPKPMLQVGDRPLLELIVDQLRAAGIRRVNMATHYKGEIIAQHFGNGHGFGVEIVYVTEDQPLGTAGALTLVEASDDPILVINGDILTRLDVRSMLEFHREHDADMTVAVKLHEFQLPYGVVEIKGTEVVGISEKPKIQHFINAGVYLLRSNLCKVIPANQSYDMPDLIQQVLSDGGRVVSFPVHEYWLDIGQADDYEQAKNDHALGR